MITLHDMMTTRPVPDPIQPGEESVWDYPRPPKVEAVVTELKVVLGGEVIATSNASFRVLETSHPPNYYLPLEAFTEGAVVAADGVSFCEWKGRATYCTLRGGGMSAMHAAWGYDTPSPAFAALRGHISLYPQHVDACYVDGELVEPQPGGFYGGWITRGIKGPFKGVPGSRGW